MADGGSSFHVWLPRPMLPFLQYHRHKVAHGGRGGGKSWGFANLLLARCVKQKTRALCVREIQKSIKQSVHRLLSDLIAASGWGHLFDVQATVIRCLNGSEIEFTGMQDHTSDTIKSYESADICWVEEAQSISSLSAEILVPTIRKSGAEIWWSFNPTHETDYVYQRFIKHKDKLACVAPVNWKDNDKLSPEMEAERDLLRSINQDLYDHVWEGKLRTVAGLLFKRRWFKFYDTLPANLSVYMASDYAGAPDVDADRQADYTEHGIAGLDEVGDLYLMDWYSEQADPEQWITAAVQLVRRHKPKIWFEEKGVLLRALDSSITKRLRERDTYVYRNPLASAGSKAERALGFAARASAGAVWLPKSQPWAERLLNQLCAFTGEDGKTDDGVDVCSLLARGLDVMANARPPKKDDEKPVIPFTRSHFEYAEREAERERQSREEYYR